MTLAQIAYNKISLLSEDDIRMVLALVDEIIRQKNIKVIFQSVDDDVPTITKATKRNIDISKYAGGAGDLFGSVEAVDAYIKETRSDERF